MWSIPLLSALQKPCFSSLLLWVCGVVLVSYLACPLPASLIHSPSYILLPISTLPRLRGLLAMAKSMHDSSRSLQLYPELQVIPQFLLSTLYTLHACVLSRFSHVILFVTLWAVAHQAPLSTDSPGKNTGVGCHALLQGSSQSRNRTSVSCIAGRFFTAKPPVKPFIYSILQ